jgi:soluble lytic murein transglycosylase-like protein
MSWLMLWLLSLFLFAETPQEHAARVRAQMQASLAAQREAIRQQAASMPHASPRPAATVFWSRPASVMFRDPPPCDPVPAPELASWVNSAAQSQSLNPLLIQEVARQESGFRPCAVSSQGAAGLMQLMPITQIELGVRDPWDPRQSIDAGSRLLRQLLDRYHGDVSLALGAYNAGAGTVDRAGGVPDIPETRSYVESILNRLLLQSGFANLGGYVSGP